MTENLYLDQNPISFTHTPGQRGISKRIGRSFKRYENRREEILVIPPELGYGVKSAFYGKEITRTEKVCDIPR